MPVKKVRVVCPPSRVPSFALFPDSRSRAIPLVVPTSYDLALSPVPQSPPSAARRSSASSKLGQTEAQTPESHPLLPRDPLPASNLAMDDLDAAPNDAGVVPDAADATPKAAKNDDFYRHWDRFLRIKEKEKSKLKGKAKRRGIASVEGKSRTSSTSGTGRIPNQASVVVDGQRERAGPSLDRDVEGRPGHPMVRSNTEGVISR